MIKDKVIVEELVKAIKDGKLTIDNIPESYLVAVQEKL
jgi:hypothetical protein